MLWCWFVILACAVDVEELARPHGTVAVPGPGAPTPPPAPGPSGEKLYQLLYAGERGESAHPAGQRARMLAWMDALALTPAQVEGMLALAWELRAEAERAAEELAGVDRAEREQVEPIYRELIQLYARGAPVSDAELEPLAARLEAARAAVDGPEGRVKPEYVRAWRRLQRVQPWIDTLTDAQQAELATCRFFLARRHGPFTNPGDYGEWLGTAWTGGDFGSLRATLRPTDEGHMDIGGLWAAEDLRGRPGQRLQGLQLAVLVLFAMEEEGLIEAGEVRLGRRAPLDFTPAVAPTPG